MIKSVLSVVALTSMMVASASAHDSSSGKASKVALVYEHVLPNVPGKSIKGVLVEYGPGGFSEAHTHPQSAFIYATVLEGSIRSQVNDGPIKVYRAGESFSEMPGIVTASARTAARPRRRSCWRSSWSIPTRRT